jgi:superfamily II DNA or RNA helicase
MQPRKHQAEAVGIANRIVEGEFPKRIVQAFVTPGGGKTKMAADFARVLLDGGVVARVLWVAPRDNLRAQVAKDFAACGRYALRPVRGDRWPSVNQISMSGEPEVGVVTTYQALAAKVDYAVRWAKKGPVLAIFDELHHLANDGRADVDAGEKAGWTRAAKHIAACATYVLGMSGTLSRGCGGKIALVDYSDDGFPNVDITYTRRDALAEQAVLPIQFKRLDGLASYQHLSREHVVEISKAKGKSSGRALRAAFADGSAYRDDAVLDALKEWKLYRKNTGHNSRAIIVADTQLSARHYASLVRREMQLDVVLAISDEEGSARRINRFRDHPEEAHVLVTVGMAHEGLDVPDCTHLICLTRYRTQWWLEQAFARVTRVDRGCRIAPNAQVAFIYVPDDPAMNEIITKLNAEQRAAAEDDHREPGPPPPPRGPSSFVPDDTMRTATRISADDIALSDADSRIVIAFDRLVPEMMSVPIPRKLELARMIGIVGDEAAE